MGDEFLFQQLAGQNVETLSRRGVRRIVTHCPHCFNSLGNDYPQVGGEYEVVHHSQLLAELVAEGHLKLADGRAPAEGTLTYHDPCYLARASGVTEAPRAVLTATATGITTLPIIELPRNGRQTSCCGAGGGRMWFDDSPDTRIGRERVQEIANSSADTVAVACPFCLIMIGDGMAVEDPAMRVRDIAEILADSVLGPEDGTSH
jgi:Fe-S oxidoreductase